MQFKGPVHLKITFTDFPLACGAICLSRFVLSVSCPVLLAVEMSKTEHLLNIMELSRTLW